MLTYNVFYFQTLFQTLGTFFFSLMYLQAIVEITESGVTHIGPVSLMLNSYVR